MIGRFPSNFIYTGCDEVFDEFAKAGNRKSSVFPEHKLKHTSSSYNWNSSLNTMKSSGYNDEGTAARYFQDINNVKTNDDWFDEL